MKFKKSFICGFTAFLIAFSFVFSLKPGQVFATDSYTFEFPDHPYIFNIGGSLTPQLIANSIYNNSSLSALGYTSDNSYFFVNYNPASGSAEFYVVFPEDLDYNVVAKAYFNGEFVQFPFLLFESGARCTSTLTSVSSATFSAFTSVQSGNDTSYGIGKTSVVSSAYNPYLVGSWFYNSSNGYNSIIINSQRGCCFGTYYIPPYQDNYLTGVICGFDFSVDSFYDWLINTGKYSEIPSSLSSTASL